MHSTRALATRTPTAIWTARRSMTSSICSRTVTRPAAGGGRRVLRRHRREPPLDLGDRVSNGLAPGRVRRQFELSLQFDAREAERLALADPLGIDARFLVARRLADLFQLFHPLLQSSVRVNQSFSSVTHVSVLAFLFATGGSTA